MIDVSRRAADATVSPDAESAPGPGAPGKAVTLRLLGRATVLAVGGVAAWASTRHWLATGDAAETWGPQLLAPVCVIGLLATMLIGQERRWNAPRRRLRTLIREIRAGRMPIESLKDIGGGLSDLAIDVATLFHDARRLEKRVAEKEIEADQRVASKADALHRVIGSLRLQAIRDPLTGLFNRRALDELLPRLIDHCRGAGEDLSVLMIDVDHFKALNDNLGHAAGDEMLKSIGQLIRSGVRSSQDAGFRCGGDEFVVVMPGAPLPPARALAERLANLVANLAKTLRVTPKPGLSVGVCALSELPSPTAGALLAEADKRLYAMKQNSRTRSTRAA